jgi:outer membrane protein
MFKNVKKTLSLLSLSAALAGASFAQAAATPAAPAATGPVPNKVGILDVRNVIGATNEFRRDFEQLAKKFDPKRTEVEGLRTEIEQLKKQLGEATNLTDADRASRVRAIEQKQKSLERVTEDAQNDFQTQQNEILQRVGGKLMDVVDKYAKQHGYSLIVDANSDQPGPVLWASDQVNISRAILDAYNQQSGVPAPAANAPSAGRPAAPSAPKANPPAAPAKKPASTPKQ